MDFLSELKSKQLPEYKLKELSLLMQYQPISKDIIIIVHDQLKYFKKCIESIYEYTNDFNLYIWDNNSKKDTLNYLNDLSKKDNVHIIFNKENIGFCKPNNEITKLTKSPYLIFLNSDTEILCKDWDSLMIAILQQNKHIIQTGYQGCFLNRDANYVGTGFGEKIDYIGGWCFCISRDAYNQFGLFDENLKFAYYEDSELGLRYQTAGYKLYGIYNDMVLHYGNQTIKTVLKEENHNFPEYFLHNKNYINQKYRDYLDNKLTSL